MIKNNGWNSMFGTYQTKTFADEWSDAATFTTDLESCGLDFDNEVLDRANTIFYLLYARYGNSHFANMDINQSRYKIFTTIWMYAPS